MPHKLTTNQTTTKKIVVLKRHLLLLYATTTKHFFIGLWYANKSGFYTTRAMNSWTGRKKEKKKKVVGLRRSSKALPKSKLAPKKCHGHCCWLLTLWSTRAFWISVKPLHLRSMLSKLMRCTENCKAWSWHWPTEWTQFFSMTTPNFTLHNQQKLKELGFEILPHSLY